MSYFSTVQARPFGEFAKCLLNSKGRTSGAADFADVAAVSTEVRRELRSIGLLSELAASTFFISTSREFISTMRPFSALDQIVAMAHIAPMKRRLAALTAVIEGEAGSEGAVKAVSSFDLTDDQLTTVKAICMVIQSAELASALGDAATDFLLNQVRGALGPASDKAFFNSILNGVSATAASGVDASAFRADIAAALQSLGLTATSRPAIVVDPAQAISLSTLENSDGSTAFRDLSFLGGEACGVPVLVSSGIPANDATSPGTPQVVVLDCQGLAIDPGQVVLNPANHATVEIEGERFNMFQDNLVGLLIERIAGASVVRSGAVTAISGTYGEFGTSP